MIANLNKHFFLFDFAMLDNPTFRQFVASAEFVTYLLLRRLIWRGASPHHMGLHTYYLDQRKLTCSPDRETVARALNIHPTRVSAHFSKLKTWGVIESIPTGRQVVLVFGEWLDVNGDGSNRSIEWFFLDRQFGVSPDDVIKKHSSDVYRTQTADVASTQPLMSTKPRHQMSAARRHQPVAYKKTVNGNGNGESTVTVGSTEAKTTNTKHPVAKLKRLDQPPQKTEDLAREMAEQLGDKHSLRFYYLVADRVPDANWRPHLAEIKLNGAKKPAQLFNYRMRRYAEGKLQAQLTKKNTRRVTAAKGELVAKYSVR